MTGRRPSRRRSNSSGSAPRSSSRSRRPRTVQAGGIAAEGSSARREAQGGLVRLNKFLADYGVASRRACDELIAAGKVLVDDAIVTELGTKIDPIRQKVTVDGFVLPGQEDRRRYYLLNKPKGVVCTNDRLETRPRAVDLITDLDAGRIYTIGRLDEESRGLILLTNDGEFAQRIAHPRYGVPKTYRVVVQGMVEDESLQKIREGVHLSEGKTSGARVVVVRRSRVRSTALVTLREGMNREIRRIFARVGHKVLDLTREEIGPLVLRGLREGKWRKLSREEVEALLSLSDEEAARNPLPEPAGDGARSPRRRARRRRR
ncbi:MAG: rRNA pseudouridine synthase [Planctomycetes bacterium]|nr:rRNA pseudouridine synthase [Planctomycetota bacterium]